jgi:hypothetical protein
MRKTVRQSIDCVPRQPNSKVAANCVWIVHDTLDLIQTSVRNFGINMDEPKDVAVRGTRTSIHLYCSISGAYDQLIAAARGEFGRAISASAIGNDNFGARRSLMHLLKKWADQRRLVADGNNDGELHLHSNTFCNRLGAATRESATIC